HFTYYQIEVDGWMREYWVYVPDSAKNSENAVPLVLSIHGSGGTGWEMITRTDWHKVADRSDFIVAYPTGLYNADSTGAGTGWNTGAATDVRVDDSAFIRAMIAKIEEDYAIDASRIYACGHSAGTGMATGLAVRCSDLFAAIATSAPVARGGRDIYDGLAALAEQVYEMGVMFSLGTLDEYCIDNEGQADVDGLTSRTYMDYWQKMYGFESDSYGYYENGNFKNYVFCKADGTPVYQWTKVIGKLHAPLPEEEMLFYEFMSKYSRGENGELLYMGK
ncbi:MAG: prolyl oligopeptidase family serine peptidase, partial [Clostridia bacterium]|nr:prolyl oligopeptidase family serine peptidase [Clostridia bacterium]